MISWAILYLIIGVIGVIYMLKDNEIITLGMLISSVFLASCWIIILIWFFWEKFVESSLFAKYSNLIIWRKK